MTSRNNDQPRPKMTREELNSSLIRGARSCRIDMVEKALELGADANASDSFGLTPMHLAATNNNVRMIQVLMRYGAAPFDVVAGGVSPFCAAVISGRLDAMRLLATHSIDLESSRLIGKGALELALVARKFDVAEWLVDHGADVNQIDSRRESLLCRMIQAQHTEAVFLLMDSGVLILPCALRAASALADSSLLERLSVLRQSQVAQLQFASPGATVAQAEELLDEMAAGHLPGDESFVDRHDELDAPDVDDKGWPGRRHASGFGRSLKRRTMSAIALTTRRLHVWGQALASLPNLPAQRRMEQATRDVLAAMHANQPLWTLEVLSQSEPWIRVVDHRGLNLLQSWVAMTDAVCKPSHGSNFDGRLSPEQSQCVDVLKSLSSRVDGRDLLLARFVESGNTILHELIAKGHAQLVMHILSVGSIRSLVNSSNHELSRPLHLAAKAQDPHLMSALVNAGGNLNALDRSGFGPLHISAFMLDQGCAETAIALGANIRLSTRQGQTLDDILNQRRDQSEALRAIVNARRAIDSAKSIFSSSHPLAGAIRHGSSLPTSKAIKPFVPGFLKASKRSNQRDAGSAGEE